jgi:type I restriction enzyme S subunit
MSTNLFNPADQRKYPKRWALIRGKQLFATVDHRSTTGTEELLSVSHITGVTPRTKKNVTMFKSESLVNYKICRPGDIAANTMWTWQGAIGVSKYYGVISPSYNVYSQRKNYYDSGYLDLLLREPSLIDVYHSISTGIRNSRLRLYPDAFLTIRFPVPPRQEQEQIVKFLDWKNSSINRLMYLRRKEIDELEELKVAVIDHAVTHGLHADTPLVDSGVDWIGKIPAGWKVERLKTFVDSFAKGSGITAEDVTQNGDIQCVRYGEIYSQYDMSFVSTISHTNLAKINSPRFISHGDILCAGTGELVDEIGKNIVYLGSKPCIAGGDIIIIKHSQDPVFLNYALNSTYAQRQKSFGKSKLKVVHIKPFEIGNIRVALPPIEMQREIAIYLDNICALINHIIAADRNKIDMLRELKSTLISDVVTGRIDVRNIEIPEYEHMDDEAVDYLADEDNTDDETI